MRATSGRPLAPPTLPGRRVGGRPRAPRRAILAAALLALAALVCIDCFNLIQSEAWIDLSRAPHVAAITRATSTGHKSAHRAEPNPDVAFVAAAVAFFVGCRAVGEVARHQVAPRPARYHLRPPLRAPPALRFDRACL